MMMVPGLTHCVAMTAVTGPDAVEHAKISEEFQCPEHGRTTNLTFACSQIRPDFLCAEVIASRGDKIDNHLTRASQPASS